MDTSTENVILVLYIISSRRGAALLLAEGLDGVRKATWLSRMGAIGSPQSHAPSGFAIFFATTRGGDG